MDRDSHEMGLKSHEIVIYEVILGDLKDDLGHVKLGLVSFKKVKIDVQNVLMKVNFVRLESQIQAKNPVLKCQNAKWVVKYDV